MTDWGNSDNESNIEIGTNGISNTYRIEGTTEMPKNLDVDAEYISIYDSKGSTKSKIISVLCILAVIVFCGIFFYFLYRDNSGSEAAAPVQKASARNVQ